MGFVELEKIYTHKACLLKDGVELDNWLHFNFNFELILSLLLFICLLLKFLPY
jgi:hypothetical protein